MTMRTDTETADIADSDTARGPSRLGRGLVWSTAIACLGLLLGVVAIIVLRAVDKPAQLLKPDQLRQLSLTGTWKDKSGATIVFSPANLTNGKFYGDSVGGDFQFVDMPNIFDGRTMQNPPPNARGYWTIDGQTDGYLEFFIPALSTPKDPNPQVALFVEGSASAPVLVCRYPDNNDTCTFRKQ
jgi:hypothetical protein